MNDNNNYWSYILSGVSFLTGGLVTEHILSIICVCFSILSALLSIAFTIYKWARNAFKDKKITADEIDELIDEIEPQAEEIVNIIKKEENNEKHKRD